MKKTIIIIILLFLVFILLSSLLTQFFGVVWSKKELYKSVQPSDIDYESFDPYVLRIIKMQYTFYHDYIIFISSENNPDYGHLIMYPSKEIFDQSEINDIKVHWTNKGINLELYLNTEIFIPKKNFIKGR